MGHYFRNAYAPFQDKKTDIAVLRGKYVLDVGKGVDVFGKVKFIDETDKRMNDARFLPYQPGDCPGGGVACHNYARTLQRRPLHGRHLRQPAGDHRQRRHTATSGSRSTASRTTTATCDYKTVPARRRLPAHRTTSTRR